MQRLREIWHFAITLLSQARSLGLTQTAASLAFLSLLALVPVFSIGVSVLTALPVFADLRDALQDFIARNLLLPAIGNTLLRYLNEFSSKASELSLAGAVAFFATAFGALLTIDDALNRIWHARRRRSIGQRLLLYWGVLTFAPLVLGASLTVNGIVASEWLRGGDLDSVRNAWYVVLPWLLTLIGLSLLYKLVPNAPVRWSHAVAGAILATVALETLRDVLGLYLARLPTYTVVYGAFAVLPLLLVWLWLFWFAVLGGALLAARLRSPIDLATEDQTTAAQRFGDAVDVLRTLAREAPRAHGQGLPARAFATVFQMRPARAIDVAGLLEDAGYLERRVAHDADAGDEPSTVWDEHWSLAEPASNLRLRHLFERLWGNEPAALRWRELDQPLDLLVATTSEPPPGPQGL
ncbi:MAG: YihY family inner membrane protein [Burkholderiaceae bacterium]|nr:YihY family inner membrane protein [Burkholderiaceae bacterium]